MSSSGGVGANGIWIITNSYLHDNFGTNYAGIGEQGAWNIDRSRIISNGSAWGSVLDYCYQGIGITVSNTLIVDNYASNGTGVFSDCADPVKVINCTIVNNTALGDSGAAVVGIVILRSLTA